MKAASALLRSDAGHCSDRVTLQRPMNTTSEEIEKGGYLFFFSYPGSFSFCLPAPPFSSRKDCQKTKRGRIEVKKKDYSLKLEQKPASRTLLLRRPSTMCRENFNQRPLPYVCVSLSLFLFLPLSICLLTVWDKHCGIFSTGDWRAHVGTLEICALSLRSLRRDKTLRTGSSGTWAGEFFSLLQFFFCAESEVSVPLSPLHFWGAFLCIYIGPELQWVFAALPSTTVLINLHFCMHLSSKNYLRQQ